MEDKSAFGKVNFGNNGNRFRRRVTWTLKEGDNVYRIVPPIKSLQDLGKYAVYYKVHWGYRGVNKQDPKKVQARPFMCIQNKDNDTGMITTQCPECASIEAKKNTYKLREAAYRNEGKSPEDIAMLLAPLEMFLSVHQDPDCKWHINVMDPQGQFGVLKISNRTFKKLRAEINRLYEEDGIDSFDPDSGVWFNICRQGQKLAADDTIRPVSVSVTLPDGSRVKQLKSGALTEEQRTRALVECPDLSTLYNQLTSAQIAALVESSEEPEEVDAILAVGTKKEASAPRPAPTTPPPAKSAAPQPAPVTPAVASPTPPVAAPEVDEELAKAEAAYLALKAKKATPAVVPNKSPAQMTDEEFMAAISSSKST